MKKILLASLPLALTLSALEMPPMPPGFGQVSEPAKEVKKVESKEEKSRSAKKSDFPAECKVIPPMLFMLPPPLQKDLDACTDKLNMPKKDILLSKLEKLAETKVEVLSIKVAEGIKGLYRVEYKKVSKVEKESKFKVLNSKTEDATKVIFVNTDVSKVFINSPIELK